MKLDNKMLCTWWGASGLCFLPSSVLAVLKRPVLKQYNFLSHFVTPCMSQWAQPETQEVLSKPQETLHCVTKHWNRLPREAAESPTLGQNYKAVWTWSWTSGSSCPSLGKEVGPHDFQRFLLTSTILWLCDSSQSASSH